MISVEDAKRLVKKTIGTLGSELIPLKNATGRVVAQDIKAPISLPPFRQSAMDGYAIRLEDATKELILQGVIKAGDTVVPELKPGHALRIFTGAMVPDAADVVVMQEKVTALGGKVRIEDQQLKPQLNIRPVGEQVEEGTIALPKGTLLNPGGIGYAASFGLTEIDVIATPKIAMAVTGDELIQPGGNLKPGQIFESNSITIQSVAEETGYQVDSLSFILDDFEATRSEIESLVQSNDVLILTGGISVGDYDFVWKSLTDLGCEILFYKVKQKPGKPLLIGKVGKCYVFALPGNPYAALSCYYQYVLLALDLMSGKMNPGLREMEFPLAHDHMKKGDRAEFLKASIKQGEVHFLGNQASSMLSSFTEANAIAFLPADKNQFMKGEPIKVSILP